MKNKSGFTLVELLAVIAILSIIMIISVPKVINQINVKKVELLEANKGLIISAARNYVLDYNLEEPLSVSVSQLCDLDYMGCPVEDPVSKTNMNGYVNADSNKIYTYSEDEATYWAHPALIVNLNGGSTTQTFEASYLENTKLTLINPTKSGVGFTGWTVSGTGSSLNGDVLTFGTGDTTLTATWSVTTYTLTVNANSGTWVGTTPQNLLTSETTTIVNPTRSGYVFNGWTVSGAGSSMSGTTFTMGTANSTLTANWLTYASMYTYTGSSTVVDDGSGNWRIKFLTSGTFTPLVNMTIDAFLVGGGGGGAGKSGTNGAGGGGGGGYTGTWGSISLTASTPYSIVIGGGGAGGAGKGVAGTGGTTTAFGYSKSGGLGGSNTGDYTYSANLGGVGGCGGGNSGHYDGGPQIYGGTGGSDGSAGSPGAAGQGTTTREFGEAGATLYSGGGGGAAERGDGTQGPGGVIGGGSGGGSINAAVSGTANTGGGGGGGPDNANGGSGGTGIAIIRNHR